ncbi:respiratory nitrate reductase subunit gamma [Deinococcus cellulosilyticus]|uniref:Uncharacterized protein n=1 Tax=Deinococcus cellulosilyticus (strain DSM 18568 / NBRC 106333 / KACC 11606 / 5516J-15) TaxID=1223518 RepID=A0A511N1G5_DEIC1|nr:respiratory nitrate reductase subunit gamma [Deinococcus cellulosilyticus]GEM46291.1 hypothetical protein DC3_19260 [Deinococcus cellulosilyticus NBRC 106333 = KACC 11606]
MQTTPIQVQDSITVPLMDVTLDRRGVVAGVIFSVVLLVLVYFGSNQLRNFDGALAGYCFCTVFALFGIVYRYAVWLQRPATQQYWKRGWELFWKKGHRLQNTGRFFALAWEKLLEQRFIRRRSKERWLAHQLIFWGCVLAILVTFPLSFGWLHFASLPERPDHYYMVLFGMDLTFTAFAARSFIGWIYFHMLNIAAVLCIAGVILAVGRRMRDEAEITTQRFDNDMIPLILLFAVSVTGMMLTVSNMFMEGKFYYWITTTHAVTVMLWLLYLPFGKFFHIFQRIANVGVWFYKAAGEAGEKGKCARCGEEYISLMQQNDLKEILPPLGFNYQHEQAENWQNLCPSCRRKLMTLNQFRVTGREFM